MSEGSAPEPFRFSFGLVFGSTAPISTDLAFHGDSATQFAEEVEYKASSALLMDDKRKSVTGASALGAPHG